jgi:putative flippase GtrA
MYQRVKDISEFKKQIIKFGLIGFLAVFVDMGVYYLLLNSFPESMKDASYPEVVAKSVSFMCGTFVTYNLNKIWTWRKRDKSRTRFIKFMALYGLSMLVNVAVNTFLLFMLHKYKDIIDLPNKYLIAFVGATGTSAMLNFAGQKIWVFKGTLPAPSVNEGE